MADPIFLNTAQVAEYLSVTTETLRLWRHKGLGPAWEVHNGRPRYPLAAVETFRAERRQKATPAPDDLKMQFALAVSVLDGIRDLTDDELRAAAEGFTALRNTPTTPRRLRVVLRRFLRLLLHEAERRAVALDELDADLPADDPLPTP